jgi:hypothetical protein
MSLHDLLELFKAGGSTGVVIGLLFALYKGWLVLGRELTASQAYGTQMKDERDAYREEIAARDSVTKQALELADALKSHRLSSAGG